MSNRVFHLAMMTAIALGATESLDVLFEKGRDTSLSKKARKERARMLTRQRMAEIAANGGKQKSSFTPLQA